MVKSRQNTKNTTDAIRSITDNMRRRWPHNAAGAPMTGGDAMPYLITGYFSSGKRAADAAGEIRRRLPYARLKERALEDEGYYGPLPWLFYAHNAGVLQGAGFFPGAVSPFPASLPPCGERFGEEGCFMTGQSGASYSVAVFVEDRDRSRAERLLRASGAFGMRVERVGP